MPLGHEKLCENPRRVVVHDIGSLAPEPACQIGKLGVSGSVVTDRALPVAAPKGWQAKVEAGKEDKHLRKIQVRSRPAHGTTRSGLTTVGTYE